MVSYTTTSKCYLKRALPSIPQALAVPFDSGPARSSSCGFGSRARPGAAEWCAAADGGGTTVPAGTPAAQAARHRSEQGQVTPTTPPSMPEHSSAQELGRAAFSTHPSGKRSRALTGDACSLLRSYICASSQ